ncbi:hypothetical protein AAFC00_006197 [Neodothiora populina]|uniref:Uncharacterized protein n=1 Tax=Neodothiora populina TaxID=2781224 RepID=A0ABR3P4I5_9PEZI
MSNSGSGVPRRHDSHESHADATGRDIMSTRSPENDVPKQENTFNFVFETGSGVRKGGHSVRSQAAKYGWTSRQRNSKKAAPARPPPNKRRKVQHHTTFEGVLSQPPTTDSSVDPVCGTGSSNLQVHVPISDAPASSSPPVSNVSNRETVNAPAARNPRRSPSVASAVIPWNPYHESGFSSFPLSLPRHDSAMSDVADDDRSSSKSQEPPGWSRRSRSPSPFFEVVLNEDCPCFQQMKHDGNPFSRFPVSWTPLYGRMIERYRAITAAQIKEIHSDSEYQKAVCDLPLQLTVAEHEPALLFALMSTTSAMLERGGMTMEVAPRVFQRQTVKLLNDALENPKRVLSSATILAVTLIALAESTQGHAGSPVTLYQAPLRRMINARGGLEVIYHTDAYGPTLVQFLVWCDKVISSMTGNDLTFPDWTDESVRKTEWTGVWERMRNHLPHPTTVTTPAEEGLPS